MDASGCAPGRDRAHQEDGRVDELPPLFCWTRFGTEAGETIDTILRRKEQERRGNGGVFLWGIGSAIAPSMKALVHQAAAPEAIFTPMKSAPRLVDVSPPSVVVWTSGKDLDGHNIDLPPASVVTSRAGGHRAPRHYALVCYSNDPLELRDDLPSFTVGTVRNLVSCSQVGASQVTAVVRYDQGAIAAGPTYRVAMRVRLVPPFLIELADPRPIERR